MITHLVKRYDSLISQTEKLQTKLAFYLQDTTGLKDTLKRSHYTITIHLVNELKNNLETANTYILNTPDSGKENLSSSYVNYYLKVSAQATKELGSYELSNPANYSIRLDKLNNEVENFNYIFKESKKLPARVDISIQVLDSTSKPESGWKVSGTYNYLPEERVDLRRTNSAGGRMRPGNIKLTIEKNGKSLIKEHFLDATDPSTWKIDVYLNDYNL